jgi:hypothetical protein
VRQRLERLADEGAGVHGCPEHLPDEAGGVGVDHLLAGGGGEHRRRVEEADALDGRVDLAPLGLDESANIYR